jgi:ABC-type uncharacterized transport system ATPase subunit
VLDASEFAIEVGGLRKTYDGHTYELDGVNLAGPRGAVFALLGPNGAGKTTIVEILEGFSKPISGRVSRRGESLGRPRPLGAGDLGGRRDRVHPAPVPLGAEPHVTPPPR